MKCKATQIKINYKSACRGGKLPSRDVRFKYRGVERDTYLWWGTSGSVTTSSIAVGSIRGGGDVYMTTTSIQPRDRDISDMY